MNTMLIVITALIALGLFILLVSGVLYHLFVRKPFKLK
jgi:hypothetical protein